MLLLFHADDGKNLGQPIAPGELAVERLFIRPLSWYGEQQIELRLESRAVALDRLTLRLQTLPRREGYWLDTGMLKTG